MRKMLAIGLKDLRLIFQDRTALILMLLTPFLITLGLGFVSGAFAEEGESGIRDIPVMIINHDAGDLGEQLVDIFESDDLADLIEPVPATTIEEGRVLVNDDELVALLIIPEDFSDQMIPNSATGETAVGEGIELYRSPSSPISASVVEAIVSQFLNQVDTGSTLVVVTIDQLVESGEFDPSTFSTMATRLVSNQTSSDPLIAINTHGGAVDDREEDDFNLLAYLAPGMALFFLMYTVTLGGSSILRERTEGTFDRIRVTPTTGSQVLGGKVMGIFLTGVAQVGILVVGSTFLYGIRWGDWVGVLALIISAALAATGWGLLIAGAAQTQEQVAGIGTAVMLTFGAVSGTFAQIDNPFVNSVGAITPNQWALQGFLKLGLGQSFADVLPNVGALWLMAAVVFTVAVVLFRRKGA